MTCSVETYLQRADYFRFRMCALKTLILKENLFQLIVIKDLNF